MCRPNNDIRSLLVMIMVATCMELLKLNVWAVILAVAMLYLPLVGATSTTTPFPDIPFTTFSTLIVDQFGSQITLSTVLLILLSLTSNTDLLNLHARQKTPQKEGEITQRVSSWMKAFVWSLQDHLGDVTETLFKPLDNMQGLSRDARTTTIGRKIDAVVEGLQLTPSTINGQPHAWLGTISQITPIRVLCPNTAECQTSHCGRALRQVVRERDVSHVTLCEGTIVYHNVALLTGACGRCQVL